MLGNTYRNLEVICVNDGSTDGSLSVLREYAAADPRVRVIDQPNCGVSAARNAGLDAAAGEYISFVDSDDRVHRKYFEIMEYFASENAADMAVCEFGYNETDENAYANSREISAEVLQLEQCFRHDIKTEVWRHLYRSAFINACRFDEGLTLGEDTAFNVVLLGTHESAAAVFIHAVLYYWKQRGDSITHSINMAEALLIFSDNYRKILERGMILTKNRTRILCEAMKEFLNFRYTAAFLIEDERKKQTRIISDRKRIYLKSLRIENVPLKDRAVYTAFLLFPFLYRIWRISIDPTMLDWERIQRQKRKEKRTEQRTGRA